MKRMFEGYGKTGPARKKQIVRRDDSRLKEEVGLPEDVRVTHSGENNPHDG